MPVERLFEVGDDVSRILEPDTHPDQALGYPGPPPALVIELAVSGRGRVSDERVGPAEARAQQPELERLAHLGDVLDAAFDLECQCPTAHSRPEELRRPLVIGMVGNTRVVDGE